VVGICLCYTSCLKIVDYIYTHFPLSFSYSHMFNNWITCHSLTSLWSIGFDTNPFLIKYVNEWLITKFIPGNHFQRGAYFRERHLSRTCNCIYTWAKNGVIERDKRTILENIRCMLLYKKLSTRIWGEAAHNYCLQELRVFEGKSPLEAWCGVKLDLSHM
jgi:hypothetical protein